MKVNIDFYTDYEDDNKIEEYNEFLNKYRDKINKIVTDAIILNKIKIENIYLGIGIVTSQRIHELNKEFRDVDRETDVLSFPMFERDEFKNIDYLVYQNKELPLGDIVLCMDVIEKQAIEYGTGFDREMLYMITHGICHLLGYDHIEEKDKLEMRKMEESILSKIGEV